MKLFILLISLFITSVLTKEWDKHNQYSYMSSFYGCPGECSTQEDPKCEIDLPDQFVALHEKYFEKVNGKFKYCSHYYVGMTIDLKNADGEYRMVRGQVVDQCGTCAETQVDLNQPMFEKLAQKKHGILDMIFVILGKQNEVLKGPVYYQSDLKKFAEKKNKSPEEVIAAFMEAAKKMNTERKKDMKHYPWEYQDYVNPLEPKVIGNIKISTESNTLKTNTTLNANSTLNANTTINTAPVVPVPVTTSIQPEASIVTDPKEEKTDAPVTSGIIGGTACVIGAAAVIGFVMLKRSNPQKYDDLKQKFPEAFSAVKRSVSRRATTIKKGINRSRKGSTPQQKNEYTSESSTTALNNKVDPSLSSSANHNTYTFTLRDEDGIPCVTMCDEPYNHKININTNGSQPW